MQAIAAANVADGMGHSAVARLSKLGSSGRYPGNVARDLHRSIRKEFAIDIKPYRLRVTLQHKDCITVPVLPPHEMFAAAWANGHELFGNMYWGSRGAVAVDDFWKKSAGEAWVQNHPMLQSGTAQAIPCVYHTDGVEVYSSDEYFMWTHRSALTDGNLRDVKHYVCCVAHHDVPENVDRQRVEAAILQYIGWSMTWAGRGVGPTAGFGGERLTEGTFSSRIAGKALAGGWKLVFAGASMDLKARRDTNLFSRHYLAKYICEQCCAVMPGKANDTLDALSYRNFTKSALWRSTKIDHDAYMEQCADGRTQLSPWHVVPGWRLELCLWDWMHTGPLGTARDLCASAICTLLVEQPGPRNDPNVALRAFCREFKTWMSAKRLKTFRCRFAWDSLRKSSAEFPEIPSYVKAAQMKWLCYFIAEKSRTSCTGTWPSKMRSVCLWAYCRCTYLMEISGVHFSPRRAAIWAKCMQLHLVSYQWLSRDAHDKGLYLWHLKPKAHVMDHLAAHVLETRRNPLVYACFKCEDFLGKLKRIALKCHGGTMPAKLIERVQLRTALRWRQHRIQAAERRTH